VKHDDASRNPAIGDVKVVTGAVAAINSGENSEFRIQNGRGPFNRLGSPILREGPPNQREYWLGKHYPKISCQEDAESDHRGTTSPCRDRSFTGWLSNTSKKSSGS
jgi:hypothetical protein